MAKLTETTLVATDEKCMEVLKRCDATAEVTQYGAIPENSGMLITVSHGDNIGWLTEPRISAYKQEINYVIIPYGQREKLEEIHELSAGKNVVFIPQFPIEATDKSDYYLRCILEAEESIKALIKLIKSDHEGIMAVTEEDIAEVLSYGGNTYKAIFSVRRKSDSQRTEDLIDDVISHRLVCAKPVMALYKAFLPLECQFQHIEKLDSAFEKSMGGVALDECGQEVIIIAVYDKTPECT